MFSRLYWRKIRGTNNVVSLGKNARLVGYVEMRGRDNKIVLGDNVEFSGKIFVKGNGQTLTIGANSTLKRVFLVMQEGCDLTIGEQCMFSREVEIRTSDSHSVIEAKSGKRVNPPGSVVIGNHVWIGARAFISKGSVIGNDCVVGAMSFVNGVFAEPGVMLAGAPAKIVRHGITWHRQRRRRFAMGSFGWQGSKGSDGKEPDGR